MSHYFRSRVLCFSILILLVSGLNAYAKSHPYSVEFENKVKSLFLDKNQPSSQKIDSYIARLQQKRKEIVGLDENNRLLESSLLITKNKGKEKSQEDMVKRLSQHETNVALLSAINSLQKMKNQSSMAEILNLAYNALDIEATLRIEGALLLTQMVPKIGEALLVDWVVPRASRPQEEASNLYLTQQNRYASAADISELKKKQVDLSQLSPRSSSFWEKPERISAVDIKSAAMGKTLSLYKGVEIEFPADNVFYLEDVKYSDTKPKVDVYSINSKGKKEKFKLKFGGEIHADPTVSALMMALGYPTDITRYSQNIKLVLGKKSKDEFIRDWESYYKRDAVRSKFKVESYIAGSGQDLDGNEYILFKEGLIEAKPKKIERLGPWSYSDNSHDSFREVRGLMFLQIWLDNTDSPDFLNNRLLIRREGDQLVKSHIISDPGKSLGWIFGSMPEVYWWNVVSGKSEKGIKLSFLALKNGVKNKITWSDARWATRMIAELTRDQIAATVQVGGWDACIAENYVNRIISRRNDLVQNLELVGEKTMSGEVIKLLPVDKTVRKKDFDGNCDKPEIKKNYTSEFDFNFGFLVRPLTEATQNALLDAARSAISNVDRIVIKNDRFATSGVNFVGDIIINPAREIEKNPNPQSADEQYIVRESLRVGFRGGLGFGVYADYIPTLTLSLTFPMRSLEEARLRRGFVVNALLPKDVLENKIPEKSVLVVEHSVEKGVGVNIDDRNLGVPLTLRAGFSQLKLSRTILDSRSPDKVILYGDTQGMDRRKAEAFLGLGIFQLPVFESYKDKNGKAEGFGVSIQPAFFESQKQQILSQMVSGKINQLKGLTGAFDLKNNFSASRKSWNLIFAKGGSEKRLDQIVLERADQQQDYLQYRLNRHRSWSFLSNGETRRLNIEVYSDLKSDKGLQVNLSVIGLDKNTRDKELSQQYLGFINGLSVSERPVIPFTPELGYTTNGKWGTLLMTSDNIYSAEALRRLLELKPSQFYSSLMASIDAKDADFSILRAKWARLRALKKQNGSASVSDLARIVKLSRHEVEMMSAVDQFLPRLQKAQAETSVEKKIQLLAETLRRAVYVGEGGFYKSTLLGALHRIMGVENIYSQNIVSSLPFKEVNMLEETPLVGELGRRPETDSKYLVFAPLTPVEQYFMFDSWF